MDDQTNFRQILSDGPFNWYAAIIVFFSKVQIDEVMRTADLRRVLTEYGAMRMTDEEVSIS
jgi:hypothetical protein